MSRPEPPVDRAIRTEPCAKCGAPVGVSCKVEIFGVLHDGAHHERIGAAYKGQAMTLRELLDDTILRLGLCDRVNVLAVRKFLDGTEAQRAEMGRRGLADQLEPEDFAPERHLTPAGGPAPYESIEIAREGGAG